MSKESFANLRFQVARGYEGASGTNLLSSVVASELLQVFPFFNKGLGVIGLGRLDRKYACESSIDPSVHFRFVKDRAT